MAEDTHLAQRLGVQVIVTLPEHIDASNAGRIGEELLSVISRGATLVIADMTTTLSCDQAGADGIARACQRAAVNGTQVRLVVPAQAVRGALSLTGLERLVSICPSLAQAIAAGAPAAGAANTARQAHAGQDLLDKIVHGLLGTGLCLQAAINMPGDVAGQRITEALQRLDETIREIRDHAFTHQAAVTPPRPSDGDR